MKKFLSILLALVMMLSIFTLGGTTAVAQDKLVRIPSTIPRTDISYNYVENVTVKIPGTEVTFILTEVADFVLAKEEYSHRIYRPNDEGIYIHEEYTYDIPVYHFTFFGTFSSVTVNQTGTWYYYVGGPHMGDIFSNYSIEEGKILKTPSITEETSDEDARYIRNKFKFKYDTFITTDNECVSYDTIPVPKQEKLVARVEFEFINPYCALYDDSFTESDYGFDSWDKTMDISEFALLNEKATLNITEPTQTTINYKDGIILKAEIENLPDDTKVKWSVDNDNFEVQESTDGSTLTAISNKSGTTIFTATLYNADGDILAEDTVELTSKAGFMQKFLGFFKGLFGLTKIYDK